MIYKKTFITLLMIFSTFAMEEVTAEIKEKLFIQFCAAQEVKENFFEFAHKKSNVRETKDYNKFEASSSGIVDGGVLINTTRIILPIGSLVFGEINFSDEGSWETFMYGNDTASQFWREFYASISAEIHPLEATFSAPLPSIDSLTYRIAKKSDGETVPTITEGTKITTKQAQQLWQEMQERYEREKNKIQKRVLGLYHKNSAFTHHT